MISLRRRSSNSSFEYLAVKVATGFSVRVSSSQELEKAEKGNTDMSVSYGLCQADDISLTDWQCTILITVYSVSRINISSLPTPDIDLASLI